jgi:hypothetical protein
VAVPGEKVVNYSRKDPFWEQKYPRKGSYLPGGGGVEHCRWRQLPHFNSFILYGTVETLPDEG